MPEYWIGIGANQGDAREAFDATWLHLSHHPSVHLQTRSGIYHTSPVGQHAGGIFSNAVFSLATSLPPLELLERLHQIEADLGRTRDIRWGPRPIDLDVLFIDQLILNDPKLTIPHPAAWYRRFVLDPLLEVAPSLRHPALNQTITELHDRITRRPLMVGFHDPALPVFLGSLCNRLPDVQFVSARPHASAASAIARLRPDEPNDAVWLGTPVADLTRTPGDLPQRVLDFLAAMLDEPVRIGDW